MVLRVLIVGAGICGPALAILLQGSNPKHKITILERSPSLRLTGQQIDLKTEAPHILTKMGLMDVIRSYCVDETGIEIVNFGGKRIALFGVSPAGQRQPGLTSEHEIMRGDMVQVLYNASLRQDAKLLGEHNSEEGLTYVFGQTITTLTQDADGVEVTLTDGRSQRYDLVVAADGQSSRTRRLAFGQENSDAAFRSLGVHGAYYSVPKAEDEDTLAKSHLAHQRRWAVTRSSGRPVTGILLYTADPSPEMRASYHGSVQDQKAAFAAKFESFDWQTRRLLDGIATCDDFYAHELGQIKMECLFTGRVVLLGDAGYGPSPFTGLGTNFCLMGAYILAGELAQNNNDLKEVLESYEEKMRPVIDKCQRFPTWALGFMFPSSRVGVWITEQAIWALSKLTELWPRWRSEDDQTYHLPEYPELKLDVMKQAFSGESMAA